MACRRVHQAASRGTLKTSPSRFLAKVVAASLTFWSSHAQAQDLPDLVRDQLLLQSRVPPVEHIDDWLAAAPSGAIRTYPANDSIVAQTPPVIRWPYDAEVSAWQLRLRLHDGSMLERMTSESWLLLQSALPPGRHAWQVRPWPAGGEAGAWSHWRHFTIPRNAFPAVVPPADKVFAEARDRAHPRAMPYGKASEAFRNALLHGERSAAYAEFVSRMSETLLGQDLSAEPPIGVHMVEDGDEKSRVSRVVSTVGYREARYLRAAALIWSIGGDTRFLEETKRRLRSLLSWAPQGSTGLASHGHVSRTIALSLALALDLTYEHWSEDERTNAVAVILARGQDIFDQFLAPETLGSIRQGPANSHGYRHAGGVLAMAALMAGEHPRFAAWWSSTFPAYAAVQNPWGGDDGGFANGVGYANWNIADFMWHWDLIWTATGFDFVNMAWPQQVGWYLTYFMPPQSAGTVFGDAANRPMSNEMAMLAHGYARRVPRPAFRAHAEAWSADPPVDERVLFVPSRQSPRTGAGSPPAAAVFPSIGWAAMHSSLGDPERSSIYFRSSPFGSASHNHASQNEFVVHSRGRVLALASGYYDYYRSRHHEGWTVTTRAHNAVTFDGGRGQLSRDWSATGRITAFGHGEDVDHVVGDATPAYGGALQSAIRTLAYLRQHDALLVYDHLRSASPRRWEWNVHSRNGMVPYATNAIGFADGAASLCVERLAGPDGDIEIADRFPEAPVSRDVDAEPDWPDQHHATFRSRDATPEADYLFLLRINCGDIAASSVTAIPTGGYHVQLGRLSLAITAKSVVVTTSRAGGDGE